MNSPPIAPATAGASTRPYLIRALHDWCTDNGFTPYIAVFVDATVRVPAEYVKNNEIVLNVGFEATSALKLGNEAIEFRARFGGTSRDINVPVDHVIAIYARENGQGMAFPMPSVGDDASTSRPVADEAAARGPRLAVTDASADKGPGKSAGKGSGKGVDKNAERAPGSTASDAPPVPEPPSGGRPSLKRIK